MLKIMRSCYLTLLLCLITTSPLFADDLLMEMLRSCPVGSIAVDVDGVCINTLNVDFLSAGDAFVESLSVIDVVATGDFIANTITANVVGNATSATTAVSFSGSLVGDVTGTQGATVVSAVGGQNAANVASATTAANAATNANTASTIVKRDSSGNFTAGTITANLTGNAATATATSSFSGSLVGDVTGTQGATVVSTVGGQTASNIAAGAVLANAATSSNTVSTIIKRDSSGNFAAGTITASLSGNATTATSATSATTATNFSGSLAGNVTGTQGATVVATVGGQTAANVAAATVLANAGTSANTASTLVLRNGSGNFSASAISMTDGICSGNLILSTDPSTSTAGSVMKGSSRFIHDFGTDNTFMGINSGNFSTSGTGRNTGFGENTLTANTTGANNSAVGYNALSGCTTGSNNVVIGSSSGTTLTTGSNDIYISNNSGTSSESNTIRIGTNGTQTSCFIQGIRGVSLTLSGLAVVVDTNGQLGTVLSSEKFKGNIKDMDDASSAILSLRPVTFTYRNDITNAEQFGLIAEEVEKVFPAIVVYDADGNPLSVQYHVLPVLLLNEIQKQRNMIDNLEAKTDDLSATNEAIINAIVSLQEQIGMFIEKQNR